MDEDDKNSANSGLLNLSTSVKVRQTEHSVFHFALVSLV